VKRVAIAFVVVVLVGAGVPAVAAEPDPLYPVLQVADLVSGSQQAQGISGADQSQPFGAHPGLMPDWNHDGVFGNAADYTIENSDADATGAFRFPCIAADGNITYELEGGGCGATGVFRLGQARKLRVVDAVGWEMQAAIFLPEEAIEPAGKRFPGTVFSNGAQAPMQIFYMYTMTLASRGIIVMNFDFAGQGQSEGEFSDNFFYDRPTAEACQPTRPCRDTQDMVRWFTGADVVKAASQRPGSHDPRYEPTGENPRNPYLDRLDTSRVGLLGESMGSLATSNYLPSGKGIDGRPLPQVKAAVGLSGFGPASAAVPFQMQTSDLDIPGYDAENFGFGATDGPVGTKDYYDKLRASGAGNGALELIVIESGSHGDHSNSTRWNGFGTPHAIWAWQLSTSYAANWMGCYLQDDATACASSRKPMEHLSRAQASEVDVDGPSGAGVSRCVTVPDKVTLQQLFHPDEFILGIAGMPVYDCTV
jgi:hypothetical protein